MYSGSESLGYVKNAGNQKEENTELRTKHSPPTAQEKTTMRQRGRIDSQ